MSLLAFAQTLPTAFSMGALPLIWRQHDYSLLEIGVLQLLYLPWVLKVLWAPLVDRVGRSGRSLIRLLLIGQWAITLVCLALALLSPGSSAVPTFCAIFVLAIASATADNAGDALTIRLTPRENSERVSGFREAATLLAVAIGSGGGYLVASTYGWAAAVGIIAGLSVTGVVAVLALREITILSSDHAATGMRATGATLRGAFARSGALWLFGIIALASAANRIAGANPHILLADLGLSAAQIGLVTGLLEPCMGMAGAGLAGFLSGRLGFQRLLPWAIAAKGVTMLALAAAQSIAAPAPLVTSLIVLLTFFFALIAASFGGLIMRWSRNGSEATDAAAFFTIAALVWLVLQPLAGLLADVLGYAGMFVVSGSFAFAAALLLPAMLARGMVYGPRS
ncbi:MAG: MFS transporter [Pseudomonadota bacterium]